MKKKLVLLYSGGLDSMIAAAWLETASWLPGYDYEKVYFALGHRYESAEIASLPSDVVIDRHLQLGDLEGEDAHIPGRNMLLASAAALRGAGSIVLVVQQDEMVIADRSPEFMRSASVTLSLAFGSSIDVWTPFAEMDKTDMVKWWIEEGLDRHRLVTSWSCYKPTRVDPVGSGMPMRVECGACPACLRKFIALHLNGVQGMWAVDPRKTAVAGRYVARARAGDFSPKRTERTLKALLDVKEGS